MSFASFLKGHHYMSAGKLVLLDLANNSITARGAFHVAEYVKKSKSLLWLNLYMNDIKDEVIEPLKTFTVFFLYYVNKRLFSANQAFHLRNQTCPFLHRRCIYFIHSYI